LDVYNSDLKPILHRGEYKSIIRWHYGLIHFFPVQEQVLVLFLGWSEEFGSTPALFAFLLAPGGWFVIPNCSIPYPARGMMTATRFA